MAAVRTPVRQYFSHPSNQVRFCGLINLTLVVDHILVSDHKCVLRPSRFLVPLMPPKSKMMCHLICVLWQNPITHLLGVCFISYLLEVPHRYRTHVRSLLRHVPKGKVQNNPVISDDTYTVANQPTRPTICLSRQCKRRAALYTAPGQ